jgi:hypothetical protein
MFEYEILQYLIKHPELTYNGIEWNLKNSRYKEQRVDLFQNLDEIEKCMEWLDKIYVPSSRNKDETNSYVLKHYVENYYGEYFSNGAFVTAVMIKEIDYVTVIENPNVFIKLHPRPLEEHRFLYKKQS